MQFLGGSLDRRIFVRLRYPLIHHGPTAAADQIPKPAAQESVFLVGHKRLAVLPAQAQIVAPAVLAPLDWHLISRHVLHPSSATQHTTETGNSQGHGELLSENYHFAWPSCSKGFPIVLGAVIFEVLTSRP